MRRPNDSAETLPMPTAVEEALHARSRLLMAFGIVFLLAVVTLVIVAQSARRPTSPILVHDR
jgi:hypothetical protein